MIRWKGEKLRNCIRHPAWHNYRDFSWRRDKQWRPTSASGSRRRCFLTTVSSSRRRSTQRWQLASSTKNARVAASCTASTRLTWQQSRWWRESMASRAKSLTRRRRSPSWTETGSSSWVSVACRAWKGGTSTRQMRSRKRCSPSRSGVCSHSAVHKATLDMSGWENCWRRWIRSLYWRELNSYFTYHWQNGPTNVW